MPEDVILSIWDRVVRADGQPMSPEVAAQLLRLRLSDADRERVGALSRKAEDGTLSEGERAELEAYSHAAAFLTILQSKARVALRSAAPVSGNGTPAA
jgi:hypothetical protein